MSSSTLPLAVGVTLLSGAAAAAGAPAAWRVPPRQPGVGGGRPSDTSPDAVTGTGRGLIGMFAAGSVGGAVLAERVGWDPALAGLQVAVQGGVWLAVVDLRVHRLPMLAVMTTTATAGILLGLAAYVNGEERRLLAGVAGAVAMRFVYRVNQVVVGGMGAGDLRLAFLLGGVGGWVGWCGWMTAAVLPFALSALSGILMVLLGHRRWGESLPFGPAVALSMIVVLLLGGG